MGTQLNEQEITERLIDLLKISSPSQHEKEVAAYIKQRSKEIGLHVIEDETKKRTGSNVGNVICTMNGNCPSAPPIFFTAHMDTIEDQQVHPLIEDGWVMSDGSTALGADDKVGVIALLETMHYLKETNVPHGDIQFLFTVCEEQGLVGARALDPSMIHGSIGYTVDADQPVGTFVTRSPALAICTITVRALSEQTSSDVMNVIAAVIRSIFSDDLHSTSSISMIGFEENKEVGHYAMDVRFKVNTSCQTLPIYMNQLKKKLRHVYDGSRVAMDVQIEHICSSYAYTSTDPIVTFANQAATTIGLQPVHIELADVSDANVLTSPQRSTLNIGAGYEQMHTNQERIELTQLYTLIQLLIAICIEASRK